VGGAKENFENDPVLKHNFCDSLTLFLQKPLMPVFYY
jgi:hypothetical protein